MSNKNDHQPVVTSSEQGVTYAAANSGAFALEDSVSMTMQDAQIQGSQMLLRSAMSYDAAARASSSKKAFVKGTELLFENIMETMAKRTEISLLHGGMGLGVKSAMANVDSTHTVVTISDASFAAGIWGGSEGAKIQFYTAGGALVSSGADAVFVIDSVDLDAKKLTISGTATGISAIDGTTTTAVHIFFKGSYANEMAGLRKIISNTGSLFNVDAAAYSLWRGNSVTISGALTFAKILSAVGKCVERGLNEKVVVEVNPVTWGNLASDLAALRKFDSSYDAKVGESGVGSIKYHGVNGEIEIISHNLVKAGEAFIFPPKKAKRIGAQEISFKTPGREDEIFLHMPNNAGFEVRCYSDQAVFVSTPARCAYLSGITNS